MSMGIPSQIFINDDCTESFYCLDDPDAGTDGCVVECTDNQVIFIKFVKFLK